MTPAQRAMGRAAAARALLFVGLLVAGVALTRLAYFTFFFDTWVRQHVPAPAGLQVPFEESVLVRSDELEARAREGTALGWRMTLLGGTLSAVGATGAWLTRRRTANP